jgi:DNA-binding transcriptional ArsR family regulator
LNTDLEMPIFNLMVELELADERLDAVFHALADSTRRTMLQLLSHGECSVGELGAPFRMSFAGASKHVKTLERAGLVSRTVQGRAHVCRLEPAALATADAWLRYYEGFWNNRLDALEQELRREEKSRK